MTHRTTRRLALGQWHATTGGDMTPNIPIVGGSGSVGNDMDGDTSYVQIRAEQINTTTGMELAWFEWFPDPVTLPTYPSTKHPTIDFHIRAELVDIPAAFGTDFYNLYTIGPLSGTATIRTQTDTLGVIDTHRPSFPSTPPYNISADRWNDIRNGDLQVGIIVNRNAGDVLVDPFPPHDPYPPGTAIKINIYEIAIEVSWVSAGVAASRLIYPRPQEGRRIYPPPPTQQAGRRTGTSSPL